MKKKHVEIAGAGIAGLTVAAALAQRGWSVRVHERGKELREIGAGIFIWENGLKVLEEIKALEEIRGIGEWMESFTMIDGEHDILSTMKFTPETRLFTVLRTDLHRSLVNTALKSGVDIVTDSHVVGAGPSGELILENNLTLKADLVIGADGLRSKVRDSLGLIQKNEMLDEGCARLLIKRNEQDPKGRAIEYWSGTRRVGYVPCNPDYVYIYLTSLERDEYGKQMPVHKESWIKAFPHLEHVLERLDETGRRDQIPYITCKKWSMGKVAIVGDSAHAMPPNLGQGAGLSLTNGLALAVELDQHQDLETALKLWEEKTREIVEVTQRWSTIYGDVSSRWPSDLMDIRSNIIWAALRSKWIEEEMSRATRYVVQNTK